MTSSNSPDFDLTRFKQLERAGFNQIAARYAEREAYRLTSRALIATAV